MKSKPFVLSIVFLFLSTSIFISCDSDENDYLNDENKIHNTQLIDRSKVESPATNK